MQILRKITATLCAAILYGAGALAHAAYPDKPIKIVVPFPAGGVTDILGRAIGQKLSERFSQPVVVDNRAGAGGTIGSAAVAKSAPDGYTLLLGAQGPNVVSYALVPDLPYHPLKDFAPVTAVASVPNVLVVLSSSPYKTLADLIAAARANPGKLSHASTGIGASPQLGLEVLKMSAKVNIIDVMYKGAAPALTDVLAGHVTMTFDAVATSIPHIKSGKLRPLAVSGIRRVSALPEVPTVAESGYPNFDVAAWYGFWAPAGTSADIARKLNEEINQILATPALIERMNGMGVELMGGSVDSFAAFHKKEFERWTAFIRATGAKGQ